jgi:hypothetical protein
MSGGYATWRDFLLSVRRIMLKLAKPLILPEKQEGLICRANLGLATSKGLGWFVHAMPPAESEESPEVLHERVSAPEIAGPVSVFCAVFCMWWWRFINRFFQLGEYAAKFQCLKQRGEQFQCLKRLKQKQRGQQCCQFQCGEFKCFQFGQPE